MTKKKKLIIGAVVVVVVIGVVVAWFLSHGKKEAETEIKNLPAPAEPLSFSEMPVVSLAAKNSGQELILTIETGQSSVKDKVEYELIYYLEDGLSRGAMGEVELTNGRGEKDVLLGTCSRNVCRYDEGVTGGEVIISLSENNKLRSFEMKFAFLETGSPYQDQDLTITTKSHNKLVVLSGGGVKKEPEQEITAGPYLITGLASDTISFDLSSESGSLLFWDQNSWEIVNDYQDLPLGTYLLVRSS